MPTTAVTQFAEGLELFMEHPFAVVGEGTKFNVHLTVLSDGAPIRSGRLRLVATGPTGKVGETEQPAPRSPGIFGPTLAFPESGTNRLQLILESEQARGTLHVPVEVYADDGAARTAAAQAEEEATPDAVPFLKEQAWKIGLRTEPVGRHDLVEHLDVPGRITPAAGAEAVISTPVSGRLLPPAGGAFPRVGQRIEAGQVVALVEPPLSGPEGVQFLATQAQVRTLQAELQTKLTAADVEVAQAKLELDLARKVFDRTKNLASSDAVARRQLDEDENRLLIAEETYRGKQKLREPVEQAIRSIGRLLGPTDAPDTPPSPGADPSSHWQAAQIALKAPLSGTVTAARAVQGEFVDGSKALFTVIDLARVWVEAEVSEFDLDRVVKAPAADLTVAAHPGRTFAVLGQGGGTLIDVGSVVDPDSRTVPVRYEIPNPDHALRVGLLADVAIETQVAQGVVAVPEGAVVEEEGRPIAYVLLDGESFQKRDLELGLKGHGLVEVKKGLEPGERVVVSGAYAIRLSSVSGVIPAHGHTH
jgi:biotin carboxyl carrier protein